MAEGVMAFLRRKSMRYGASWSKEPWSWEDMVAQYQRLHTTQMQK